MAYLNTFHDLHREKHSVPLLARRAAAQLINTGVNTVVLFDTVDWDPESAYSTGTGAYTCPLDGVYRVMSGILYDRMANFACAEPVWLWVAVNGTNQAHLERIDWMNCGGSLVYPRVNGTALVVCAKGDTIQIYTAQGSGVNINIIASSWYNHFHLERVAPYRP